MGGQLAGRERELHAMQRRALRTESVSGSDMQSNSVHTNEVDEVELWRVTLALQAVETRTAALRQREVECQEELRLAVNVKAPGARSSDAQAVANEESIAESSWRQARSVGAELGEANAALARRRAQEQHGNRGGESVVAALEAVLQDAEEREASSCGELAQSLDRLAHCQKEQYKLRQQSNNVESRTCANRIPFLEREVETLEHESSLRSRELKEAEAQLAARQRGGRSDLKLAWQK